MIEAFFFIWWRSILSFCQKLAALLCLSALLFGCSLAAIGGRYADWYVLRRIDTYVDLTDEQKAYLEPRIDDHLAWIKVELLPDTNKAIGELITRVERGITSDDLTWIEGRIEFLRARLYERLMPDTIWLFSRLSPEQMKHMEKELNDSVERSSKKMKDQTPDEFQKEKFEQYEKSFEDWVGSINDPQKQAIKAIYGELASIEHRKTYLAGRAEVQAKFFKLITSPVDEPALREFITTWLENPAELRSGISKEHYLKRTSTFRDSLLKLQETLSNEQRKGLVDTLRDHQKDILTFSQTKT